MARKDKSARLARLVRMLFRRVVPISPHLVIGGDPECLKNIF